MSLYDWIDGNKVSLFYSPTLFDNTFAPIGGNLHCYNKGEKLPLKTLYYEYPQEFFIFDFRAKKDVLHIKDGVFLESVPTNEIEKVLPFIVDIYGRQLNIKKLSDFDLIYEKFQQAKIKHSKDEFIQFYKDWLVKDKFQLEKLFGEAIYYYQECKNNLESLSLEDIDEEFNRDLTETYQSNIRETIEYLHKMMENNPNIKEKYKNWLNNSSLYAEVEKNLNEFTLAKILLKK